MIKGDDGKWHEEEVEENRMRYKTDLYVLELFNSQGELLYKYPLAHYADGIRIINKKIYILDKNRSMRFHIYEISA